MSRTNSYIVKFQVPGKFAPGEIFWTFLKIEGVDSFTQPKLIHDLLMGACIADIKKHKQTEVDETIVDIQMISLVDSYELDKQMYGSS